ncbi:MAG: sigma-54 dependent transcriptional regulator [Planctomycetota bacterium]|nr:sigma-54 dependent transcriptional regulator [Planctomycetota bacterium]MEC9007937.1 sigma-54 dependent transcriptional regulator [Planctomycetota bacterium]MEE3283836.1 sigma-54 dependent transcriptional regulator [Planctomycetota bacterium]MEE3364791.1 sigma-54 dependent transcriptional regulator [Planctomycetota bacterium]
MNDPNRTPPVDDNLDSTGPPIRVLVVDDDEPHAQAVAESLERVGYECITEVSGEDGATRIESDNFDVVVTDLMMGDLDGLALLQKTKEELPNAEVILLTGHASVQSALAAGQAGASMYLTKPLDINELRAAVKKASTRLQLLRRNAELARRLDERFGFEGVIGNSPAMNRVLDQLKHVAPTSSTVLIEGESGTGKELVARALHQNSDRKSKPFVPLNISALPESILESELFGHEAGAFTGAVGRRIGKFEFANGGTLFLDEVGEMPTETQIKLLRVLEDRKVARIGANEENEVNVRMVAATNADLENAVREGRFREDLYYRIAVVTIDLPPLRERRADVPLLIDHFRKELSETHGRDVPDVSRTARQALIAHDWPGNIRQLRNTIERMLVLDSDGLLDVDDLPDDIVPTADGDGESGRSFSGADGLVGRPLADVERFYIDQALELVDGKREDAAALLGIGERTLYRKIKEYGLNQ